MKARSIQHRFRVRSRMKQRQTQRSTGYIVESTGIWSEEDQIAKGVVAIFRGRSFFPCQPLLTKQLRNRVSWSFPEIWASRKEGFVEGGAASQLTVERWSTQNWRRKMAGLDGDTEPWDEIASREGFRPSMNSISDIFSLEESGGPACMVGRSVHVTWGPGAHVGVPLFAVTTAPNPRCSKSQLIFRMVSDES